ncbi:uncharacterized protein LOC119585742 isoform X8 [Penaeus monodon]|uniref:uncharacterized protein LOC119585742 isoform X8 n=1 Tax=Penaeus monodon TaxID=6687 RepID=UPI0018A6DA3A|nr:uncharacterized protein LOC119585742 isoform X8 [Penaeus monodon]
MRPVVLVALLAVAAVAVQVDAARPCDDVSGICKKKDSLGGKKCKEIEEGLCRKGMVCCPEERANKRTKKPNQECEDEKEGCSSAGGECRQTCRPREVKKGKCGDNCVCCVKGKRANKRTKKPNQECEDEKEGCSNAGGKCRQTCRPREVKKGKCGDSCECCVKGEGKRANKRTKKPNQECEDEKEGCSNAGGKCRQTCRPREVKKGKCGDNCECCVKGEGKRANKRTKKPNQECEDEKEGCSNAGGKCRQTCRPREVKKGKCGDNCKCCVKGEGKRANKHTKKPNQECEDKKEGCSNAGGKCRQTCRPREVKKGKCGDNCECCVKGEVDEIRKSENCKDECKRAGGKCRKSCKSKKGEVEGVCQGADCKCCITQEEKTSTPQKKAKFCKKGNEKCVARGGRCRKKCKTKFLVKKYCKGNCLCCDKSLVNEKKKCIKAKGNCKEQCKSKETDDDLQRSCKKKLKCCAKKCKIQDACINANGECRRFAKNCLYGKLKGGCKGKKCVCCLPASTTTAINGTNPSTPTTISIASRPTTLVSGTTTTTTRSNTTGPTTVGPTTAGPRTVGPTTAGPTTAGPTTAGPTTAGPRTVGPTTAEPTTAGPTTAGPTTAGPTTAGPTTAGPTTAGPTTAGPTTAGPTTAGPTTAGPTTAGPTTAGPTTAGPTTIGPTIAESTTASTVRNVLLGRTCRNRLIDLEKQLNLSLTEGGEVMNNIIDIFNTNNPELSAAQENELTNVLTELQVLFNKTQELALLVNVTAADLNASVPCPDDEYEEVLNNMTVKNQELSVIRDTIATLPPAAKRVRLQIIVFIRFTFTVCVGAQRVLIVVFEIVVVIFEQINVGAIVVPGLDEEPVRTTVRTSTVSATETSNTRPSSTTASAGQTSSESSTGGPSTSGSPGPTTAGPTTAGPTTAGPTTAGPTTAGPTTAGPTTVGPTTAGPTTAGPTTAGPTTAGPTTVGPTTAGPTTAGPTTIAGSTIGSTANRRIPFLNCKSDTRAIFSNKTILTS